MKTNKKLVQLSLVSIGLFLIIATYFYYPKIYTKRNFVEQPNERTENKIEKIGDSAANTFENIEYKGLYDVDRPFSVSSKKAYILKTETNLVYMTEMKVTLHMRDGRIVIITSDEGKYNKLTYDCFFENNVKATDGKTVVLAETMNLLTSKDKATIYNNVILTSDNGSLQADKIDYDFETRYYQISMFSDKKVKIKLIE